VDCPAGNKNDNGIRYNRILYRVYPQDIMERRKYIRHPLSYPLETSIIKEDTGQDRKPDRIIAESDNIGGGGLQFTTCCEIKTDTAVAIQVTVENRKFALTGHVTRCRKCRDGRYIIAVSFDSPNELLKARLAEQVVRIELCKMRLERKYNVTIDFGCIAKEWIKRYSTLFAQKYGV
jgi:hypothetical protein